MEMVENRLHIQVHTMDNHGDRHIESSSLLYVVSFLVVMSGGIIIAASSSILKCPLLHTQHAVYSVC